MSNQGGRGSFRGGRGGDGYRGGRGGDGYRGGRGGDGYRGGRGGDGYRGGRGGDGYRGDRDSGNRGFDRSGDGFPTQIADMNLGSHGSGSRGFSGPPRGRGGGGGRSRTTVNWADRKPFCQNEVKPLELPTKALWKPFNPDQEGDIPLPSRKPGKANVQNSCRSVDILLNHFEVFIQFPNKLYQYRAHISRKPNEPVEGAKSKPTQGKRKKAAKVVEGEAPKMLPVDTRKRILSRVVQDMHREYGMEYGIITDFSATLYTIRRLEEKGLPLRREVPGVVVDDDSTTFIVAIEATIEKVDTSNLRIDINNMRGQLVSVEFSI